MAPPQAPPSDNTTSHWQPTRSAHHLIMSSQPSGICVSCHRNHHRTWKVMHIAVVPCRSEECRKARVVAAIDPGEVQVRLLLRASFTLLPCRRKCNT